MTRFPEGHPDESKPLVSQQPPAEPTDISGGGFANQEGPRKRLTSLSHGLDPSGAPIIGSPPVAPSPPVRPRVGSGWRRTQVGAALSSRHSEIPAAAAVAAAGGGKTAVNNSSKNTSHSERGEAGDGAGDRNRVSKKSARFASMEASSGRVPQQPVVPPRRRAHGGDGAAGSNDFGHDQDHDELNNGQVDAIFAQMGPGGVGPSVVDSAAGPDAPAWPRGEPPRGSPPRRFGENPSGGPSTATTATERAPPVRKVLTEATMQPRTRDMRMDISHRLDTKGHGQSLAPGGGQPGAVEEDWAFRNDYLQKYMSGDLGRYAERLENEARRAREALELARVAEQDTDPNKMFVTQLLGNIDVPVPPTEIPEEFHEVETAPLRQMLHDFANAEITFDEEKKIWENRLFPSTQPSNRMEVMYLARCLDAMLNKRAREIQEREPIDGANAAWLRLPADPRITDFLHLEVDEAVHAEPRIWDVVLGEIVRQVHVHCMERGVLLDRVRRNFAAERETSGKVLKGMQRCLYDTQATLEKCQARRDELAAEVAALPGRIHAEYKDKIEALEASVAESNQKLAESKRERWETQDELWAVEKSYGELREMLEIRDNVLLELFDTLKENEESGKGPGVKDALPRLRELPLPGGPALSAEDAARQAEIAANIAAAGGSTGSTGSCTAGGAGAGAGAGANANANAGGGAGPASNTSKGAPAGATRTGSLAPFLDETTAGNGASEAPNPDDLSVFKPQLDAMMSRLAAIDAGVPDTAPVAPSLGGFVTRADRERLAAEEAMSLARQQGQTAGFGETEEEREEAERRRVEAAAKALNEQNAKAAKAAAAAKAEAEAAALAAGGGSGGGGGTGGGPGGAEGGGAGGGGGGGGAGGDSAGDDDIDGGKPVFGEQVDAAIHEGDAVGPKRKSPNEIGEAAAITLEASALDLIDFSAWLAKVDDLILKLEDEHGIVPAEQDEEDDITMHEVTETLVLKIHSVTERLKKAISVEEEIRNNPRGTRLRAKKKKKPDTSRSQTAPLLSVGADGEFVQVEPAPRTPTPEGPKPEDIWEEMYTLTDAFAEEQEIVVDRGGTVPKIGRQHPVRPEDYERVGIVDDSAPATHAMSTPPGVGSAHHQKFASQGGGSSPGGGGGGGVPGHLAHHTHSQPVLPGSFNSASSVVSAGGNVPQGLSELYADIEKEDMEDGTAAAAAAAAAEAAAAAANAAAANGAIPGSAYSSDASSLIPGAAAAAAVGGGGGKNSLAGLSMALSFAGNLKIRRLKKTAATSSPDLIRARLDTEFLDLRRRNLDLKQEREKEQARQEELRRQLNDDADKPRSVGVQVGVNIHFAIGIQVELGGGSILQEKKRLESTRAAVAVHGLNYSEVNRNLARMERKRLRERSIRDRLFAQLALEDVEMFGEALGPKISADMTVEEVNEELSSLGLVADAGDVGRPDRAADGGGDNNGEGGDGGDDPGHEPGTEDWSDRLKRLTSDMPQAEAATATTSDLDALKELAKSQQPSKAKQALHAAKAAAEESGSSRRRRLTAAPEMFGAGVKSRKPFRARNERLQDVLDRLKDTAMKPKSRLWLMRLMRDVYRDKAAADQLQDRTGQAHVSMPDFLFEYLKQLYGERNLVDRNACAVVATASALRDSDPHVDTFARFLEEEWSLETLDMYLKANGLIDDLKVGLSYAVAANDLTRTRHVDTERAVLCTQLVLGERHPRAEEQLRQWLAERAEPATEADLKQLVGRQQLRNDALSAADTDRSKIDKHLYLFHACELFELYDAAFGRYVQEMFRNTDADVDGFVTKQEFVLLLSREMPTLMPAAIDEMWSACLGASLNPEGGQVDYKGFSAVMLKSDAARNQFRLSFVPDPEALAKSDELEGHQQLIISISRHWLAFTPVFQKALQLIKHYTLGDQHKTIQKLSTSLTRHLRTDLDPILALGYYREILSTIGGALISLQASFRVFSGENEVDQQDIKKVDTELGALEGSVMKVYDYVKGRAASNAIPVARQLARGATLGSIIGALTKHTRTDSYTRHKDNGGGRRGTETNDDGDDDNNNDGNDGKGKNGGDGGGAAGAQHSASGRSSSSIKDDVSRDVQSAASRAARAVAAQSAKRKVKRAKKKSRDLRRSQSGKGFTKSVAAIRPSGLSGAATTASEASGTSGTSDFGGDSTAAENDDTEADSEAGNGRTAAANGDGDNDGDDDNDDDDDDDNASAAPPTRKE